MSDQANVEKLVEAASNGDLDEVKRFLAEGADVNARGLFSSPLEAASSEGHTNVVRLLLERGADVNSEDLWWKTPLILH